MRRNRAGIKSRLRLLCVVWLMPFAFRSAARAADTEPVAAQQKSASECVRVVEDRATGLRWRVERQGGGKPNRMVLIEGSSKQECASSSAGRGTEEQGAKAAQSAAGNSARSSAATEAAPVIQVGERIVVVQKGAALEARFPAVALAAAVPGGPVLARLEIGNGDFGKRAGRVVRATAVARGLAQWDGESQQNGAGW